MNGIAFISCCRKLLCLAALGSAACLAQPPAAPIESMRADAATHKFATYSIQVPGDWQRKDDAIVAFHAAPAGAKLFPNVKVAVVRLPASATVMDSVNASKKAYASIWKIESEQSTRLGTWQAQRLILTQDLGAVKSKQVKYFIAVDKQALIVTGQSTHDTFDANLPLFEAMALSLKAAE